MKKLCKSAFFFAPLFCCLFLQSCDRSAANVTATEPMKPTQITVSPSAVHSPKDTETVVSPEVTSKPKTASEQETEETLDDILDQLDELDSILDGY